MSQKCEVSMTNKAYTYLIAQMHEQNKKYLRLRMKPTGCSGWEYVTSFEDEVIEGDYEFLSRDVSVTIPDKQLIDFNGSCIDLRQETLGQRKIVLSNPNAMDHCGCGDSFALKNKDTK